MAINWDYLDDKIISSGELMSYLRGLMDENSELFQDILSHVFSHSYPEIKK